MNTMLFPEDVANVIQSFYLCNKGDIEFLNDWWEGEKYIKPFGIKTVGELDISGGIYEQEE